MNDPITNNDAISLIAAILNGPSNFNMNTILDNSLHDVGGYINVISEEGSKKLKEVGFSENECINSKCPIFHIDFEEGEIVTLLPCNHAFSPDAIKKWLENEKAECPICRFKLPSKEVRRSSHNVDDNSDNTSDNNSSFPVIPINTNIQYDNNTDINMLQSIAMPINAPAIEFPSHSLFYQDNTTNINQSNVPYNNLVHPFGPGNVFRIARIIHENDDENDIVQSITNIPSVNATIMNILNNTVSGTNSTTVNTQNLYEDNSTSANSTSANSTEAYINNITSDSESSDVNDRVFYQDISDEDL